LKLLSRLSPETRTAIRTELHNSITEDECRISFERWCEVALAKRGLRPAAHHRLLIRELVDVAAGRTRRLLVTMPPGSAKSTYVSQLFPPWLFARRPGFQIIGASHTAELAEDFSTRIHRFIRENEAELGYGLATENRGSWHTTNNGIYFAVGVGGAVTGRRANCLVAGTRVETIKQSTPIEKIFEEEKSCSVLSYDLTASRPVYRPVIASFRRMAHDIYRIASSSGRVVEATEDHPVFTARGWVSTKELIAGDVLLSIVPPSEMACGREVEAKSDVVALVERIHKPTRVFDLQVAGTECFFANGILVHNCGIIDDPVKGRQAADSEKERKTVWDWFLGDFERRLVPEAPIVLVLTRWHELDLAGMLLETQPHRWKLLNLPAEAEEDDPLGRRPGEWLWSDDPEYGYGAALPQIKADLESSGASREWASQYQGHPHPPEGAIFKVGEIGVLEAHPNLRGAQVVRGWDLAATRESGERDPDWTVGVKLARLADGRYVVCDVQRVRGSPDEIERLIVNTAAHDTVACPISLPQDAGAAGKIVAANFVKLLAGYRVEATPETGDKTTRAGPVASQCNVGNLYVVSASWTRAFLEELRSFPSGAHDDQVDALSRGFSVVGVRSPPMNISDELLARMRRSRQY
jgi:predicted phage terminase large subunit-like protein